LPRCLHAGCAFNGLIYAVGGAIVVGGNPVIVSTVEAYDPKTDEWTPKANLPLAGYGGVAIPVNGLIYAFYGKNTFAYNPESNVWTAKAPIPVSSLYAKLSASAAVHGIVYLLGGQSADKYTTYDFTLAYDPAHDTFAAKTNMPMPCMSAAAVTIDGKIYMTGGCSGDPTVYSTVVMYSNVWMFDPHLPRCVSLTIQSPNSVRLVWQGEAGQAYGVKSRADVATGTWSQTQVTFSTGTNSILATNALIEATFTFPTTDATGFFEVIEDD
jgi:N-acetylneuraminic acid mutarotase